MSLISVIIIALTSSLSHCVFMCGGFCLSVARGGYKRLFAYHFARTLAYALLGGVSFFIAQVTFFLGVSRGVIFFVVGLFLIVIGVAIAVRGEFLAFFERGNLTYKLMAKVKDNNFLLGFLNGFLPCGLLYYLFGVAATSPNLLYAVATMVLFGLFTTPAFLLLGLLGVKFTNNKKFAQISNLICAGLIAFSGAYLAYKGFMMMSPEAKQTQHMHMQHKTHTPNATLNATPNSTSNSTHNATHAPCH